jgi:hypothetical protein
MSEESDQPKIPIVCPACGTRTEIPFSEVEDAIETHNDRLHDGDDVAAVDPDVFDHLADHVAADLGLLDDRGD